MSALLGVRSQVRGVSFLAVKCQKRGVRKKDSRGDLLSPLPSHLTPHFAIYSTITSINAILFIQSYSVDVGTSAVVNFTITVSVVGST